MCGKCFQGMWCLEEKNVSCFYLLDTSKHGGRGGAELAA